MNNEGFLRGRDQQDRLANQRESKFLAADHNRLDVRPDPVLVATDDGRCLQDLKNRGGTFTLNRMWVTALPVPALDSDAQGKANGSKSIVKKSLFTSTPMQRLSGRSLERLLQFVELDEVALDPDAAFLIQREGQCLLFWIASSPELPGKADSPSRAQRAFGCRRAPCHLHRCRCTSTPGFCSPAHYTDAA